MLKFSGILKVAEPPRPVAGGSLQASTLSAASWWGMFWRPTNSSITSTPSRCSDRLPHLADRAGRPSRLDAVGRGPADTEGETRAQSSQFKYLDLFPGHHPARVVRSQDCSS